MTVSYRWYGSFLRPKVKVHVHLGDREGLCSAENVDVEYKCSQGEDHKHWMEDIDVFVL